MATDFSQLEQIARRAWPAADERHLGGWLLRIDSGFTKRANAAYVLESEVELDLENRISIAAAIYRERGLPLIIRESSQVADGALTTQLIQMGFERFDESIVMRLDNLPVAPGQPCTSAPGRWLEHYARLTGMAEARQQHHGAIIARIAAPICLGTREIDRVPIAMGLAVADGPWVGLFDLVTDPARRREGHGRALIEGLLAWGRRQGAERAYLNVSADNAPAVALYEQLGYREAYRYWYWMEPQP